MNIQRISHIEAKNFKSLVNFSIDLPKFSCLIGLNGAGKSTVLQFIDFLSQLVRGDMRGWLTERKWKPTDLRSKLSKKVNISFRVRFCDEKGDPWGLWEGTYSPAKYRCTSERIELPNVALQVTAKDIEIHEMGNNSPTTVSMRKALAAFEDKIPITFRYEGSIFSALVADNFPRSFLDCRQFLEEIKSLDLLAPERLRQRARESLGTLGLGGQNLAAFLHEMPDSDRLKLVARLQKAYPRLQDLATKSLRSGWKQLGISESYERQEGTGQKARALPVIMTEARHINDGMLRMIAILAELQSENRFLLFDEIENGINPELVELVIGMLVEGRQQVLVTTHSPMILNYLDDDVAKESVIYLYKTPFGDTESIPFFSIPSLKKKLEVMGPGEAFVDTNLTDLAHEIAGMTAEGK